MLYKFINECSVRAVTEHDRLRFDNEGTELVSFYLSDQELKDLGFKELIYSKQPESKEFYHIETTYVDGESITEYHKLVKDIEPNYDELVHLKIREKYSEFEEFKMARTGKDTDEWHIYNNYVEECKKRAYEILEKWREA